MVPPQRTQKEETGLLGLSTDKDGRPLRESIGSIVDAYLPRSGTCRQRSDYPNSATPPAVNLTKCAFQLLKSTTLEPDCSLKTSVLMDGHSQGWSVDNEELAVSVPPAKIPQDALSSTPSLAQMSSLQRDSA